MQMQATATAQTLASVKHHKTAKPSQATPAKVDAGTEEGGEGGDGGDGSASAVSPTPDSTAAQSEDHPQTDADMTVDDETSM